MSCYSLDISVLDSLRHSSTNFNISHLCTGGPIQAPRSWPNHAERRRIVTKEKHPIDED